MGKNGLIFVWDLKTYSVVNKINSFSAPNSCLTFCLSDPIYTLFGRDRDNKKVLRAINLLSGETIKSIKIHKTSLRCMILDHQNLYLYTGGTDGKVNVITVVDCEVEKSFVAHKAPINCLSVSNDDKYLVTASDDKCVKIFDNDFNQIRQLSLDVEISCVLFSKSNKKIFTGGWNFKPIKIWDVSELEIMKEKQYMETPGQYYMIQSHINWNKECGKTAQQKVKEQVVHFEDGLRRVYDNDLTSTTMSHLKRLSQLKPGVTLKRDQMNQVHTLEFDLLNVSKEEKKKKKDMESSDMGSLANSSCGNRGDKSSLNKEDEGTTFKARGLFKRRIFKGKPISSKK
jgi:WD40 repeat protein